ncbi:hypothetical protein [Maricaulis sp. MIT060901]|uniref:hypothetical protein n=1 Tax=Maricaulis sp. MIT060901 TaxID=3096993 RepID=UPI00399BF24C
MHTNNQHRYTEADRLPLAAYNWFRVLAGEFRPELELVDGGWSYGDHPNDLSDSSARVYEQQGLVEKRLSPNRFYYQYKLTAKGFERLALAEAARRPNAVISEQKEAA